MEWHLDDLEHALTQRGWRLLQVTPRDETDRWGWSGSWEVQRGDSTVALDFEGGDANGLNTYPIEKAFAVKLRGRDEVSLYLRRRRSEEWQRELTMFVVSLD